MDAYGAEDRGERAVPRGGAEVTEVIRSRANALVKRVRGALAGRERTSVVLEGERLIVDALRAGWRPEVVLRSTDRPPRPWEAEAAGAVRVVDEGIMDRLSALDTAPGWIGLFPRPADRAPEDLALASDALALVVCGVQDPGNLGALARSLEAAGGALLVTFEGGVGPWNAKALRGSMGSLLRVPHHRAPSGGATAREGEPGDGARALAGRLSALGFRHVRAATRGGEEYRAFDWSGRIALWVSSEAGELPAAVADAAGLTIPMAEGVESLNVTVAASLLLFAAGRVGEVERRDG